MSKREFLDTLGSRLRQELSQDEVMVHIRYYDEYLKEKMSQGISEQDAVAQLGDPLLIAKTIMDVNESNAEQNVYDRMETKEDTRKHVQHFDMNSKGSCLIAVLVGILILSLVFWVLKSAISFLMPIIAPVVVVMLVISLIKIWKK